jgi:hypothetical protein
MAKEAVDFAKLLTVAEMEQLNSIEVFLSPNRCRPLRSLIDGWTKHVARLDLEHRSLHADDPTTWTAWDYIAALLIRDWVEEGMGLLVGSVERKVREMVKWHDARFCSFTGPDVGHLFARFASDAADEDLVDKNWWWGRIPRSGPVLEELLEWARAVGLADERPSRPNEGPP